MVSLDHRVDANDIVAVTSEQSLAVRRPGKRQALGLRRVLAEARELGLELINDRLALQVEDLDARGSGSAQPVAVGRENKRVDNVTGLQRVEVLAIRKLPEHRDAVLATGRAERAIGRDGDGVDVALVAVVVGGQLAAAELPDLVFVSMCSEQKGTALHLLPSLLFSAWRWSVLSDLGGLRSSHRTAFVNTALRSSKYKRRSSWHMQEERRLEQSSAVSRTYLDDLVPTSRDNHGVRGVGAEAHAAHPLGVAVLSDVELAVTERVPQLDGPVTRTRDNLAVVGAEADAQHIASVADEAAGGLARVEVPQAERLVPRGRQSELAVRGNHDVRHKVVVAVQDLLGVAVVRLVTRQLPDDDGLVARGGQQEVRVLLRRSNGSDPTLVAGQASLVSERLRPEDRLAHVLNKTEGCIRTCR